MVSKGTQLFSYDALKEEDQSKTVRKGKQGKMTWKQSKESGKPILGAETEKLRNPDLPRSNR